MLRCSVKKCGFAESDKLTVIDDGRHVYLLCGEHLQDYARRELASEGLELRKSRFQLSDCEICGKHAFLYAADVELHLCERHLTKLIRRHLAAEEYRILMDRHGAFSLIAETLYSAGGYALQPLE